MKPVVIAQSLILTFALSALPVMADEAPSEPETPGAGMSLMEEGAKLFLKGLQKQMEPAMEGLEGWADKAGPALRSFVEEMGPALSDLAGKVEDWSVYEAPEMLPNGDIIIRRKPEPTEPPEEGETDI
ncbi:MAG: hypothetical protein GYB25_13130 [Rhodobacteraceae bacterium]|nr:hypothetical protein [Paracoccaceae bacterium]